MGSPIQLRDFWTHTLRNIELAILDLDLWCYASDQTNILTLLLVTFYGDMSKTLSLSLVFLQYWIHWWYERRMFWDEWLIKKWATIVCYNCDQEESRRTHSKKFPNMCFFMNYFPYLSKMFRFLWLFYIKTQKPIWPKYCLKSFNIICISISGKSDVYIPFLKQDFHACPFPLKSLKRLQPKLNVAWNSPINTLKFCHILEWEGRKVLVTVLAVVFDRNGFTMLL